MEESIKKSAKSLWQAIPFIAGILLLIGIINSLLNKNFYQKVFGHGILIDSFIGALIGSISGGSPVNSYILGGEFLKQGVSLTAVTSFLISWVTVGFVQVLIEGRFLGMRFAIWRNILSFIMAIFASLIIVFILRFV